MAVVSLHGARLGQSGAPQNTGYSVPSHPISVSRLLERVDGCAYLTFSIWLLVVLQETPNYVGEPSGYPRNARIACMSSIECRSAT